MRNYLIEARDDAIKKSIKSIITNGIVPLSSIDKESVIPLPTLGINDINNNVCLNHLNLNHGTEADKKNALQQLVYEEYKGILGISLERAWKIHSKQQRIVTINELVKRMISNVVFIIEPPSKNKTIGKPHGANKNIPLGFFDEQEHSFSIVTGSLLNGNSSKHCDNLLEIKTSHQFKKDEIRAIMVPSPLFDIVHEIVGDSIPLIRVPLITQRIVKIPQILEILHSEELNQAINGFAPDYLTAFTEYCTKSENKEFCVHTLRLHTPFDFQVRFIADFEKNSKLLADTQANILQKQDDGSAWVIVPKVYCFSRADILKNFSMIQGMQGEMTEKFRQANAPYEEKFAELSQAKGNYKMSFVYSEISEQQFAWMNEIGIHHITTSEYTAVSYPTDKVNQCRDIISNKFNSNCSSSTSTASVPTNNSPRNQM